MPSRCVLSILVLGLFSTGCGEPPKPEVMPFVSGVNPAHIRVGMEFRITGRDLGTTGKLRLASGKELPAKAWTPTEITVQPGDEAPIGEHVVTVNTAQGDAGTVTVRISDNAPVLASITPDTGRAGDPVVLKGKRLGAVEGSRIVVMGAEVKAIKSWKPDQIAFTLPPLPARVGDHTVHVESPSGPSNLLPFAYIRPYAERMVPDPALPGKLVTIRGRDFGTTKGSVLFEAAPEPAEVVSWGEKAIEVRLPAELTGEVQCKVVNENGPSIPMLVSILTPPPQGVVKTPLCKIVNIALDPWDRPYLFTFDMAKMHLYLTSWTGQGWASSRLMVKVGKTTGELPKALPELDAKIKAVMDESGKVKNKDQKELEKEIRALVERETKAAGEVKMMVPAAGLFPSAVVDGMQMLRLSCFQMMGQKLIYGERSTADAEWEFQQVVDAPGAREGLFSALATDSRGAVHVAYMNGVTNSVHHAVRRDGKFVTEAVDPEKDAGMAISFVIDAKDRPHMAFLDFGKFDLKYATADGGKFRVDRVDEQGWTGDMPSLVVDPDGNPTIAFMKRDDQGLIPMSVRLATRAGGTWSVEVVEEGPGIGLQPVLKRDAKGRLHLVYLDQKGKQLRYGVREAAGSAWKKANVPAGELPPEIEPGRFSTAMGTDGLLRIAYWTDKDLHYRVLTPP